MSVGYTVEYEQNTQGSAVTGSKSKVKDMSGG